MKKILKEIFFLVALLLGLNLSAQESDYGIWGIYVGTGNIDKKWSLFTEFQYRDYKIVGDFDAIVARLAGQYDVVKNINLSLGYSYFLTRPYINGEHITRHEHRPYQQVIIRNKFGRLYFNHRYRFEQRFLPDDFRLRFRYFLQSFILLNNKSFEKNTIYISTYAEIFLNTESPVYDRVRFYVGLGYALSPNLRMEIGNMVQVFETFSRHQLQVFFIHNFNLINK